MSESITHLNKVLVESKGIKTYPQGPLSPLNITKNSIHVSYRAINGWENTHVINSVKLGITIATNATLVFWLTCVYLPTSGTCICNHKLEAHLDKGTVEAATCIVKALRVTNNISWAIISKTVANNTANKLELHIETC